jgi:ribosomal protein S18 acetylase RimI-like enzyme
MPFVIQLLNARHDRERFDCGEPALNDYLRRFARQNQERGVSRTFVAVPEGEQAVAGFYSLAAGSVAFESLPDALHRRLPRYPVPVAHLARLATCQSVRGRGLGEALLFDALSRTLRAAGEIGIVAVDVWAKTERARAYYERYGFRSLADDELHMLLPLDTVRKLHRSSD